jgi:hypothetical protein
MGMKQKWILYSPDNLILPINKKTKIGDKFLNIEFYNSTHHFTFADRKNNSNEIFYRYSQFGSNQRSQ